MRDALKTAGSILALGVCIAGVAALEHLRSEHRRAERARVELQADVRGTVEASLRPAEESEGTGSKLAAELDAAREASRKKQEELRAAQRAKLDAALERQRARTSGTTGAGATVEPPAPEQRSSGSRAP